MTSVSTIQMEENRPFGQGPLAIVTGGARRVGRAVCLRLADHGYDILTTYCTRPMEAAETIRLCAERGAAVRAIRLDLSDLEHVEAVGQSWAGELPRVDVIVHNASMYEKTPFGSITAGACLSHFTVNTVGPVLLTQALAALLRKSRGCVVMFCDIHALGALGRSRRRFAAYAMSKSALAEMVGTLAREMAPEVRVNGVAPGVVAWPDDVAPEEVTAYEARIPQQRPGTPEDAADAVLFLARDGKYVNGDIIRVDGGRFLA